MLERLSTCVGWNCELCTNGVSWKFHWCDNVWQFVPNLELHDSEWGIRKRNQKCVLSMENKLACFYYYQLINSRLSRPSMLSQQQTRLCFRSVVTSNIPWFKRSFKSSFRPAGECSASQCLRVVQRHTERECHVVVSNKPSTCSCLFTLRHRNRTLIMAFYLKSIKSLLIYASSKYSTNVNQGQVFFWKQACLTGYISYANWLWWPLLTICNRE